MQKRYSGPQIVAKLRQADVLIGQGKKIVIELVSLTKGTTEVKVKVGSPDKAGRIYQTIHDNV